METILHIVKIVAIIEIILITLFVLLTFFAKCYFSWHKKKNSHNLKWIFELLHSHMANKEPISIAQAKKLKKSVPNVLIVMKRLAEKPNDYFEELKKQLFTLVLKPVAVKWSSSYSSFKRNQAAMCYLYGLDSDDRKRIFRLLNDATLLISMNAGLSIVQFGDAEQINNIITTFSQGRRLQQSLLAKMITRGSRDLSPIIIERLHIELNAYVKTFCYRLLCEFPQQTIAPIAKEDFNINVVDLKIAIIRYFMHCQDSEKNELIYALAMDEHWEVRAIIAKSIGTIPGDKSIQLLEKLLCDPEWWVRVNAANALIEQGEKGIDVLNNQSPDKDRFAYETAQKVLITREHV
ncbi:HEAT repeat domain-containing protein [Legionella lytica]|uniref:HEAT repeat domain-containing protein n=1 Tax=Legionella lytica TaxID=96232 RepID=A0ABY4YAZ6_9GAMM|nr:HEAT repeat domain-containing protein [Legionella lytica]USQ14785.1 HEAT repeat domain-containing protein [Legionella lytica]